MKDGMHMEYEKLLAAIDRLNETYIRFWEEICKVESPTEYKPGVDAVGKIFIDKAKEFGWKVQVHHEEKSGDAICITMNPDAPGKAVCFSGHMDTVQPREYFPEPIVTFDETYIYGPGVKDCKGGLAASMLAMAALREVGFTGRPVKLILQPEEENTSKLSDRRTVDFMEEMAKDCAVFLNTEGCGAKTVNTATMWRKGSYRTRIKVKGQAFHSASSWKGGASAVREAAYKIIEIEKFKEQHGITMNCGLITGGTAANTVPESCEFVVDTRYPDAESKHRVDEFFENLLAKSTVEGTSATMEVISARPAMERTEANLQALARMNEVYARCGLPILKERGNYGGSDASDMTARGIPTVDSMGVEGDGGHSIHERAVLTSLAASAKRLAAAAAFL